MTAVVHPAGPILGFDRLDPAGQFAALLARSQHIPIVSHVAPDGDAVGSILGMYWLLRALGKQPIPILTDPVPAMFTYLPGSETIRHTFPKGTPEEPVDMILVVDLSSTDRIGSFYETQHELFERIPVVQIDHHVTNKNFGTVNIVDPRAASTCEMVYRLARELGMPVTPDAALCMLNGLITDTQCFRTSNTTANTLRIATDLIDDGASLNTVTEAYFRSRPLSTLRLWAAAFSQLHVQGNIVWVAVSQQMLERTGASYEETESLVGQLISVRTCDVAVLFKEDKDHSIKVSFRSSARISVAAIASHFGGGGHDRAAGCTITRVSLEEAQALVIPYVAEQLALTEAK